MALPNNLSTFSSLGSDPNANGTSNSTIANAVFINAKLVNQNNAAEGPTIPPLQQGQYRVPKPSNFGVVSVVNATPIGSLIVFSWEDIDSFGSNIGEYRIFASFTYNSNAEPTQIGSSEQSPCAAQVVPAQATTAVFYLRPYLANGLTLPIDQCPTCSVNLPAPVFQLNETPITVYIDNHRPTGGGGTTSTTYDISGTFTVPANVTSITAECWGSGGDGSGGQLVGGGGGGGGAYASSVLSYSAGQVLTVNVAGGGTGQPTWFVSPITVSADGGQTAVLATGGTQGLASNSIGSTTTNGSVGGTSAGSGAVGGAAAHSGGSGGSIGVDGAAPGGGGGGAPGNYTAAGHGASGRVKLTYSSTGGATSGIGVVNSGGQAATLTDQELIFFNPNGEPTAIIGTLNNTSGSPGYVTVADGAGNNTTILSGTANSAGSLVGYINVNIGGSPFKIAYYAP